MSICWKKRVSELENKKSVLQVLGCYVLWGCLPVFWKLLANFGPLYILSTRIVWSAVFCFLFLLLTGKGKEILQALRDRRERRSLYWSALAISVNWGMYIYAVNSGHLLDASLAYFLNPLLAILLGFLVFHERLRPAQWASLALALAGMIYATVCSGTVPYFALLIGGSFAVYGAIKKNVRADGMVSTCIESLLLTPLSLGYLVYATIAGQGGAQLLSGMYLFLLPLSGVLTAIPLLLFSQGIRRVPLSLSGILMFINPSLQMLLGLTVYHETLDRGKIVMFLCAWIALAIYLRSQRKHAPAVHR